jgi:hypothetical protein
MTATLIQVAAMQEIERQARVERDAALLPETVAVLIDLYDQCVNGISGPSPFCLRRALTIIDKVAPLMTGCAAKANGANYEEHHHQASAVETDHQSRSQSQEAGAAAGRRPAQ